ncbi:MAG: hypothetical protein QXT76_04660 [Sulfolobales archaeon]
MGSQDVKVEVIEALKWYGFYIFDKSKQEAVREIMKVIGDLRSLVKVRALPQNPNFFILEVDTYTFEAVCREKCSKNGIPDPYCYNRCLADHSRNIVDKLVVALSK